MAAGLGFKTFTTGEVLTAADTNGYLMQGVNVFASAAARTAAITSPQEGQMSFLKDTNSTEYYDGAAWVAVGGGGGGMTLLSTTTLSGATTTISSIDQTYKNLQIVISGVTNATANGQFKCLPNGSGSITAQIGADTSLTSFAPDTITYTISNYILRTSTTNSFVTEIYNYASTTANKPTITSGNFVNDSSVNKATFSMGGIFTNTAITSLVFQNSGGNFSGGTVLIYGVK